MVILRKTAFLMLCFLPTIALSSDATPDVTFDDQGLSDFKKGIEEMVVAGQTLADKDHNKALITYTVASTRIATLKDSDPKKMFDPLTYERVKELVSEITELPVYKAPLGAFERSIKDNTYDQTIATTFRKQAAILTKIALENKGVSFPDNSGNTPAGHAGFLQVNANISPKAAEYLIPGSFCLYHAQYMQRKTARGATARPVAAQAEEGKK
jgi:hypothetical protein